ncbi:ribokinase [Treponema lecithinolyticum]|uniref:Ribokinase n=1 Tax=Treponema lecithinolyticum ATCC 700332 TaxID=1321815 RepID=A0ABN0NXJ2_TRELE|nr:ribokinase [Treponema lecithinolyticum]ERJ92101.1 ribokinase [Treponema lecithinolyticum ATCC 700332]
MKKILVIGSLNVDMVVNVHHIPAVGETILAEKMELVPGGKGANQAYAAGRLGADVVMFGAVGDDRYAEIEKKSLQSAGVDTSHLLTRSAHSTGLAWISVNALGDNNIVVIPGANKTLSQADIADNDFLIRDCDILLCQLEIPLQTVVCAARRAKELGKTVVLDPAPVPQQFPEELYGYTDIIKPNETEVFQLLGEDAAVCKNDYEYASDKLRAKGVKNVIVTLGKGGAFVNSETEGKHTLPVRPVNVVDTTAAGDSFTAAVALRLAQGSSLLQAVRYANEVATIVVTRKGAQTSIPTASEVPFDN